MWHRVLLPCEGYKVQKGKRYQSASHCTGAAIVWVRQQRIEFSSWHIKFCYHILPNYVAILLIIMLLIDAIPTTTFSVIHC
jgi:hypothetical protein